MKEDKELQQDVFDELKWNPSVNSTRIGVSAIDGVITLTGQVSHYAEKAAAERIAKKVIGVKGLANDIEVHIPSQFERNDTEIAAAVLNTLKWNAIVPDDKIKVIVKSGWVTLEGQVEWYHQKKAAFEAIKNISSVKGVSNEIEVKALAKSSDVKQRIKAALHRIAETEENRIEVETNDGEVKLRGTVKTWTEKEEAEDAAWMAPGVSRVDNSIKIGI